MSATELDEVQALLEHMLPDPAGYAQRLALQVMTQWGQSAGPHAGASYSSAAAQDVTRGDIFIPPDPPDPDTAVDTNLLLAAALGGCECWGLRSDCVSCRGYGSAGWTKPDPELFEEFVRPALARLSDLPADDPNRDGGVKTREDRHHHQTAQGVSHE
jgi:hypothetical protein